MSVFGLRSVVRKLSVGADVSHVEGLIPTEFGLDAVEVPGARKLLASLEEGQVPWAIVTSGTKPLVTGVRHISGFQPSFNLKRDR